MTDTAARLAGLSDENLTSLHDRLDRQGATDAAAIEAHHLTTVEMLKRGMEHGHVEDEWNRAVVVKDSIIVETADDIDAPEGFEKAWGETLADGGTVTVFLTVDGYVLKADPTVSDVHVDTIMGGGRRRKPQAAIFDMAKTIREEDGKFTVYSEDGKRKFGTYATREEAEGRLRQIERFSKAEGYSVPQEVQAAARRAVKWIEAGKAGDGFTSVGRNRARQLADGGVIGRATLVKMRAYFARHGKQRGDHAQLQEGEPTPWRVAWDAWGGDAGRAWVNRVLGPVEKRAIPDAITDLHLNLENRQHAIDEYLYGPMNPEEPGDYWERLGEVWGVPAEEAATTRCGNCAAFNVKDEIREAIGAAISEEGDEVVDLADLGYCELLQFKCAGSRSCSVWLTGGPISDEDDTDEDEIELLESMDAEDLAEFAAYAYLADELDDEDEMEKRGNPEALRDYWRGGGKGKISWGAGGDFTACVAAVGKYMTSEQAKGYCAIRHREVTGMWPGDKRNRAKKAREAIAKFTLPGGATYEFSVPIEAVGALEPVLKHPGHADQKVHAGRGASLDPGVASSIIERTRAQGGLSVSMVDGSEPPSGFMVARTKGVKPAIVEADEFYDPQRGPKALGSFLKANRTQLTRGDYLGVWHDKDSGKVFLDVSQNVKSRATAERLGRKRNQISIWDVVEGQEIATGGTGEIAKSDSVDQAAGFVEYDGRRDRRLRGGDLAEVRGQGLEPVLKHPGHGDQSVHGRKGGASAQATAAEHGGYKLNNPDNPPGEAGKRGADSIAAAKAQRAKVAAVEPQITRDMIDVANANGAKMSGLDQRLKSEKSLARKIDDEKDLDFGGDATRAAESMSDVARYTMTFDDDDYVAGTSRVVRDLEEKGYQTRVKNYWQDGDPYQGINIAAVHPNGTRFELQLHTPTSLDFKEPIHVRYDRYRESKNPKVRYKEYTGMRRAAAQIPKPPPPGALLGIGEQKFQPFTPTPASPPVTV